MSEITIPVLMRATGADEPRARMWRAYLQAAADQYSINTPRQIASWLANIGVESAHLSATVENLNYTQAARLVAVFPRSFPSTGAAMPYVGNPEKIANRVYAGRLGNGDEASGDGWKYRGRGLIQLTGRTNYARYCEAAGLDVNTDAGQIALPEHAAKSAGWYWRQAGCAPAADSGMWLAVRKAINGPAALEAAAVENATRAVLTMMGAA